jgi:selenophosphate synthetase-related protein
MGISDWDDAVAVKFSGKTLIASSDGPYSKRLALKSALIHASTDVVVKGAKPLFALDTVIGSRHDVGEIIASLKRQALEMKIPLLGGNTLIEDVEARCSLTVIGELLLEKPIRDSTAKRGDAVCLLGEPIWGEQDERILKAKRLFSAWFTALKKGVKVSSAKDVTKGGLVSVVYEMERKSRRKFSLNDIELPMTRNLDNFLLTLSEGEFKKIEKIARKYKCPVKEIGVVV